MSRMPKFSKGIKVRYEAAKGLWRVHCHIQGARWSHASDLDKAKMIAVAKDLERRLLAREDIRPAKLRAAAPTNVIPGTVREVGDQWLVAQAKNTASNTTESYDNALRTHIYPLLGDLEMRTDVITRDVCKRFAQDLIGRPTYKRTIVVNGKRVPKPIAFTTRTFVLNVLGVLCEYAWEKGLLATNPAKKLGKWTIDKHELEPTIAVWTHAQAAALLRVTKAYAEHWYLPLKFALQTGVRSAELVELRWTDQTLAPAGGAAGKIALARQYLSRPRQTWTLGADGRREKARSSESRISPLKGRAARDLDVWADLWAELEAHRKDERAKFLQLGRPQDDALELLFSSRQGERLDPKAFGRFVLPGLCTRAGIPVTSSFHTTRHTFATVLLTAGEPLRYVSEQLGHKNESLTERVYKHWIPDHRFDQTRGQRVAAAWGVAKAKK